MNQTISTSMPLSSSEPLVHSANALHGALNASEMATLLGKPEAATPTPDRRLKSRTDAQQNQLIQVRLGLASSLFTALRCKHAPTASHSLRVALTCSAWARSIGLPSDECDEIEVAALLHDVGKIGIPDNILHKPRSLSADEAAVMKQHRAMSQEILAGCSASPSLIQTVLNSAAWFDGSCPDFERQGTDLPIGSRILAIADAYDAMTTDHVYRRAMSRERAVAELFSCSGTQFDPEIVKQFAELTDGNISQLYPAAAKFWLSNLGKQDPNTRWRMQQSPAHNQPAASESIFESQLLKNMLDAVIFIDINLQVVHWNPAAERLTGITSDSICDRSWTPSLLEMQYEDGSGDLDDSQCPVAHALTSGVQMARRMTIAGRGSRYVPVDMHVVPVVDREGTIHGATITLHDASPEISLEERCQSLHEKATKDPLTQVANRAEFDRVHQLFVEAHLQRNLPCSLIICDIDRFKMVNDTFGHQAGDAVIQNIASVLRNHCRPGDLVARYGGEEFVVLCADCNNQTATQRAEAMRRAFADVAQDALEGRHVTASFGVTEVQPGDTPETMLRRSDRGLLTAKDMGRNTVIQLGTGLSEPVQEPKRRSWFGRRAAPELLLESTLLTPVPIKVAVEKLRGFVADQGAEISELGEDHLQLSISGDGSPFLQRLTDRPVPFLIDLNLKENRTESASSADQTSSPSPLGTLISVRISPRKNRDRRRVDVTVRARQMLVSLRSYLMATEVTAGSNESVLQKASQALSFRHTQENDSLR
jgi:diguanylate cyclase (GGDEF)-like protein/PAS domain S-box-containing protein